MYEIEDVSEAANVVRDADHYHQQYSGYDEEQLIDEIREYYGDEALEDFGVKITDGPDIVTPD